MRRGMDEGIASDSETKTVDNKPICRLLILRERQLLGLMTQSESLEARVRLHHISCVLQITEAAQYVHRRAKEL